MAQPTLKDVDPEMYALLKHEQERQSRGLELIASENFTSAAVMECLGSAFTNKYSEGLPGKRYYGGNEYIDEVENLCIKRAQAAFHLDPAVWGVNVQPYSGSPANFAVFTGVLQPQDRIMGLGLPSGGHLTHGHETPKKKVSATSIYFQSKPYQVDIETGLIDYDKLEADALEFKPKLLIAGASAYPRDWDYKRMREIADKVGAMLMTDMAHISGLVASQLVADPFEYSHIVTTTTHKSLRGPRAGLIFFRKDHPDDLEGRINFAVFPSCQGGPHNNAIAGVATQLKEVATPEFKAYSEQVVKNCRALAAALVSKGYKLATDGTDNHLILWNLREFGVNGERMSFMCDAVSITLNKNSIAGDKSALFPGGVRIGTPALISRKFMEKDFEVVADFLHRALVLAKDILDAVGKKEYKDAVMGNADVKALRGEVEEFASKFYMPGLQR